MPTVLACVDGSAYTASVCDHAAWFAGRMEAEAKLLAVREGDLDATNAVALIDEAAHRMNDHGLSAVQREVAEGPLVSRAREIAPDLVIMGKRGASSSTERQRLGANVDDMILGSTLSVCLTSQYFLPPEKVLVLMDDDPALTRALEFVMAHAGLNDLRTDILIVGADTGDPEPKIRRARETLQAREARVQSIRADSLEAAVRGYMETGSADLIVVSRTVLLRDGKVALDDIEAQSLWSWRCPVLVC